MRSLRLGLLFAALSACVAHGAEVPAVCKALRALGEDARASGAPLRMSAVAAADGAVSCPSGGAGPAVRSFCDAIAGASGSEAARRFPWLLYDCVDTLAAAPQVITADGREGPRARMKVTRLAAKLARGVRMDMSFAPATAAAWSEAGRYEVVVWAP